jgi:hypothetical protein
MRLYPLPTPLPQGLKPDFSETSFGMPEGMP